MNYQEIVETIQKKRRFGKASGREVTAEMMEMMHHPERMLAVIHIAGTNGKGSTAAFVSQILQAAGFSVGLFTSPHLVTFRERIVVDGEMISEEDVVRLGEKVLGLPLTLEPTMFDVCLAMAVLYFVEKKVDYVVLETGLGGLKDSTTGLAVVPQVSAITNIGLEHTKILGDTIEDIATQKAGILKPGTTLVLGIMDAKAEKVITERAHELEIPVQKVDNLLDKISTMKIGLNGAFQRDNAALAAGIVEAIFNHDCGYPVDKQWKFIRCGLMLPSWSGRMEIISEQPLTYIDGAHNPHGVEALFNSLKEAHPDQKFVFVMGVMADKDYTAMVARMMEIADCFIVVSVGDDRALSDKELLQTVEGLGGTGERAADVAAAMARGREIATEKGEILVAFGSLYFIGEIKKLVAN